MVNWGFIMVRTSSILIDFYTGDIGVCPVCQKEVNCSDTQLIRHYQCNTEVEVCIDCKSDFIKINDVFFRGIL